MNMKIKILTFLSIVIALVLFFTFLPDVFAIDYGTQIFPTMTSATTPSGVVSQGCNLFGSDSYTGYRAFNKLSPNLVDLYDNNHWACYASDSDKWVNFHFTDKAYKIAKYTITNNSYTGGDCTEWTFAGSNGGAYTTIDTQTGLLWSAGETKIFEISNAIAYTDYKFSCITNAVGTYFAISAIQGFELLVGGNSTTTPDTLPVFIGLSAFDFIGTSTPVGSSTLWTGSYIVNTTTQAMFNELIDKTQFNLFFGFILFFFVASLLIAYFAYKFKR